MAGYVKLIATTRRARQAVLAARDLETRWRHLDAHAQEEAREEYEALKVALRAVRGRLESGPRGFVSQLSAGYRGEEVPIAEPRPYRQLVKDLSKATRALNKKIAAGSPPRGSQPDAVSR